MSVVEWFMSFRRRPVVTAAEVQRQLDALNREHADLLDRRDDLSLDAMGDASAAADWQRADEILADLAKRIGVLTAALPIAKAREAEAARQAELAARAKRRHEYDFQTAEAQRFLDELLARLPTGEELTRARNLRDALSREAAQMRTWSNDVAVRRPLDPLDQTRDAMALRCERIDRARWIGSHPITLSDKRAVS